LKRFIPDINHRNVQIRSDKIWRKNQEEKEIIKIISKKKKEDKW
jgi:DNA-binding protein